MSMGSIVGYVNIGLIVLFVLIIIGFLLSGLRGFIRGAWKSTHHMIFMLSLFTIAFVTLNPLTDFIGTFPLSAFVKGSLYLSREIEGEVVTYYVPITNVHDTLTEFLKGFYTLYNVSASPASAVDFALALAYSILKIALVLVDVLLIMFLGGPACELSWLLIFKNFIPRVARKKAKLRWIGLAETMVTFLMVTFMFLTPFTSIVNSINQTYQNSQLKQDIDEQDEMVQTIGSFVDAYNNSPFAKVFFNWTVDKNGMTYDTRLFNSLTTGVSGDYSIGVIKEIVSLTNAAATGTGALNFKDGEVIVDATTLISKEIVDSALDAIINSSLMKTVFPIVIQVAMNSDILAEYIPNRLIDLSDVKWEEEVGYVKDMVDCIFDSQVVESLFVEEDGKRVIRNFEDQDLFAFIEEIVYSENFKEILNIFKKIDESKLLSRAIPALLYYLMNNDEEGVIEQYLPFSWEELNEFSWGYETYVLLDFLHATTQLDDKMLKAIFVQTGLVTVEDPSEYNLATLISQHANEFKALVVGQVDASGELVNVDSRGQTIVFDEDGKRIADRNYCLFDMNLIGKVLPTILDQIFDLEGLSELRANISDEDLVPFHEAVASLNDNNRLVNYKKEFNAVLDVVATLAQDTELLDALISGAGFESLMAEEGNFFSIDTSHVTHFKNAINKMDKSTVLYSALTPMLKSLLSGDDVVNTFNDIGLKSSVLVSAIDQDMKKTNHTLFSDFASLLDSWGDLNNIYSLSSIGDDTDALMDKLKQDDIIQSFKNILNLLHENPLINPTPQAGDDFEKNENLYGLLEFVFSMTSDLGITITRDTLREVETAHSWHDEIEAFGNLFQFIAKHNLMNAGSDLENGLSRTAIDKLTGHSDDDYYIRGLFNSIDSSYIFKSTLGPFLDDMFGDSLDGFLIDTNHNISFSNVTDWAAEGVSIENLLISLRNIVPENDDEAQDFLSNFDISSLDKIVDLNALLHDLAHSGIFTYVDEHGDAHYQFGKWLFNKIDASMGNFTVDGNPYDLLADPKFSADSVDSWDTSKWGVRPEDGSNPDEYYLAWKNEYNSDGSKEDTHYLAYKDFVYINGMDNTDSRVPTFWCDYDAFVNAQSAFLGGTYGAEYHAPASYLENDWGAYYGSDEFINAYSSVFEIDEISRVTKFMCYALRILQPKTDDSHILFDEIPRSLLDGLLTSLNDTHCMRAGIYNFYRIASDNVFSSYSGFSLSSAYISYMIDGDQPLFDFEHGQPARQAELDKLINLYDLVNVAREKGVFSGGNFVFENMRQDDFLDTLESTLKDVNDSYVFHRKGSSKVGELTTFQGLFNSMLSQSEIGDSIYLGPSKSPKDANNSSLYNSSETKVRYLVENSFPDDAHNPNPDPATMRDSQKSEVEKLMDVIDELYSLKDSGGNTATSISNADLSDDDNIDAIWTVLGTLNSSNLLSDLVPNTIYKLFIDDAQFSITCGTEEVDFTRIDPFYHYYHNVDTLQKLGSPNFNARYSQNDINGIRQLLVDYNTFDTALNGGEITNVDNLKNLTGTVDGDGFHSTGALSDLLYTFHSQPIFHTPARNYDYNMYYTTKFQSGGYTLFEELMDKICTFTGLDDFAYDSAFDSEASASVKLHDRIKAISAADDGLGAGICYHTTQGTAWTSEIHSIMEIAYRVADMSSGAEIDINNFNLEDLAPADVKTILTCLNVSDLVGDSVPGFVKNGFEAINLGTLTTYDTVNYANYRLTQIGYGGADGLSGAGTEIDNIYHILDALREGNNYVTNMTNISDFVSGDATGNRLTGLLKYIYESRILNTPDGQNYGTYKTVSGHKVSAQGVLLYNAFDNSGLSGFIARDALTSTAESSALDKIQQLSLIVHMPYDDADAIAAGLTYEIESAGLTNMINITNTAGIDANTFTGSGNEDINTVKALKTPILNIIATSYNADGNNHRSALVSELVSGLLNNVLENEYNSLSGKAGYVYNEFSFGKPASESYISFSHYDKLNVVERNGLEGVLGSLDYANSLNVSTILTMTDDQRHDLADALESCFALMTTGGSNSEIARVIYLNDFHQVLEAIAPVPNNSAQTFVSQLVIKSSNSELPDTNTVYSSNFFFSAYGTALKEYIYPGFF